MKSFSILPVVVAIVFVMAFLGINAEGQSPGIDLYEKLKKLDPNIPLPEDLNVVPPSPDVPEKYARFSGAWHGIWDGVLGHILVVERIDQTGATVVYAFATAPQWEIYEARWIRLPARFEGNELVLEFSTGATARYRPHKKEKLWGVYTGRGTAQAVMDPVK